ncbi:50S ribosomal protein L11 methyltransferase [Parvimonas parva]|uniref:Ribosomal protein L11 methyltransferase n=1 Tax=Parvimonas parva TaxID=2769485 RepID=A0ABS1C7F8_9FIRM|nr:50S ribosomal protein L11 methyltransferase [Parvimonas parva]MBK1468016.1 50S ribosomal protein L11 methyltransferase [Parvimonas parva]
MDWTEIEVVVKNKYENNIVGILYLFDIDGINISDSRDYEEFAKEKPYWVVLDEEDFVKSEFITAKTYLKNDDELEENLKLLNERISEFEKEYNEKVILKIDSKIKTEDWANEWKKYYKPTKVGKNFIIKPTWEEYDLSENEVMIELDPGMAFGTGTHETTALCLEALEKLELKDKLVFDIGSGSGILSVGALKLGAKKVEAVDIDILGVEATLDNAKLNKVEDRIIVHHGDLCEKLNSKADVIVANILAHILVKLLGDISKFIKDDGIFVGSGIIDSKYKDVEDALIESNFEILEVNKNKDWVCVIARRKNA